MFKKPIILIILFLFILSSEAFASSFMTDDNIFPFVTNYTEAVPASDAPDAPEHLRKVFSSEEILNDLELVEFLRPESFEGVFIIGKNSFNFSVRALAEDLVIRLFIYDEEEGFFVPVKRQIIEPETELEIITDTTWRFGLSGLLLCSFKVPVQGIYSYRLLIHQAGLLEEEYLIGENLQIVDFSVDYKEAVSFENILYRSFWDIYFDVSKYSLPLLP